MTFFHIRIMVFVFFSNFSSIPMLGHVRIVDVFQRRTFFFSVFLVFGIGYIHVINILEFVFHWKWDGRISLMRIFVRLWYSGGSRRRMAECWNRVAVAKREWSWSPWMHSLPRQWVPGVFHCWQGDVLTPPADLGVDLWVEFTGILVDRYAFCSTSTESML